MVKRGSTKIKLTAILLLKIVLTSTGTERKIHKLFPSNEIEQEAENVIPTNIANKKGIICFIKDWWTFTQFKVSTIELDK